MVSTSCCCDPEVFYNLLDDNLALSNFSAAVRSTTSVPKDPDCVIFECNESVGDLMSLQRLLAPRMLKSLRVLQLSYRKKDLEN